MVLRVETEVNYAREKVHQLRWTSASSTIGDSVSDSSSRSHSFRLRAGIIALLASAALVLPQVAQAAPSEEDIARAQAEEEAARMSVAQIEVRLATVSAQADMAIQEARIAAEQLNAANLELEQARMTASKAQQDADQALLEFEQGKQQIASVAQTAYREGAASLDSLAPYLGADGLRTVETKQASLDSFSASADAKMQEVAALEQVARVMQSAADEAVNVQQAATEEVEARTEAARASAESALALQQTTAAQREVYVNELAKKQGTTVELINEREAALEAERQAAAQAAAEEAARRAAEEAARQAAEEEEDWEEPSYVAPSQSSRGSYSPSWSSSGGASTAIAAAKSFLGVPYVWGGESYGGVDCSGLTKLAWAEAGVYLPHYSASQYGYGTHVPIDSMEPGDLIFWSSNGYQSGIYHVAMYLGGGQMIEAPTFGMTVRITSIWGWSQLMPYATRL